MRNQVRSRLEKEPVHQFAIFAFCIESSLLASCHRFYFRQRLWFSRPEGKLRWAHSALTGPEIRPAFPNLLQMQNQVKRPGEGDAIKACSEGREL